MIIIWLLKIIVFETVGIILPVGFLPYILE